MQCSLFTIAGFDAIYEDFEGICKKACIEYQKYLKINKLYYERNYSICNESKKNS